MCRVGTAPVHTSYGSRQSRQLCAELVLHLSTHPMDHVSHVSCVPSWYCTCPHILWITSATSVVCRVGTAPVHTSYGSRQPRQLCAELGLHLSTHPMDHVSHVSCVPSWYCTCPHLLWITSATSVVCRVGTAPVHTSYGSRQPRQLCAELVLHLSTHPMDPVSHVSCVPSWYCTCPHLLWITSATSVVCRVGTAPVHTSYGSRQPRQLCAELVLHLSTPPMDHVSHVSCVPSWYCTCPHILWITSATAHSHSPQPKPQPHLPSIQRSFAINTGLCPKLHILRAVNNIPQVVDEGLLYVAKD